MRLGLIMAFSLSVIIRQRVRLEVAGPMASSGG
jgi:hypothetical protein